MDIKPGCAKVSCNFRKTELITCLQFNKKPVSLILHLWGNVSQKTNQRHPASTRMDILSYCNGGNSVFQISKFTGVKLSDVVSELQVLLKSGLVTQSSQKK